MKKLGILVALLAALLLNGLTLATPAPTSADSGITHDSNDDKPAWFDLVKLRATNGEHRVRFALHVRNLQERGRFHLGASWTDRNLSLGFYVEVRHTDDGLSTRYRRWVESNDVDPLWKCGKNRGDIAWRPGRDRIIFTVPQRCLRHYDYYRVINRWTFSAYGQGVVDGRKRYDFLEDPVVLDRG
jgi:hypothetical protein